MASVTQRSNGTYLIRISCGTDANGKPIARSRIFKPSKPNLSFQKLNKEIEMFTEAFQREVEEEKERESQLPDKMLFSVFCEKYLVLKASSLSPTTLPFYKKVIEEQLIPMFGKLKLNEIKSYHVQQYIDYLTTQKPREDGRAGSISASTVKRYTTVFRSILTLAYKLQYMEDDVGLSRRLEFPKEQTIEVNAFSEDETATILQALDDESLHIQVLVYIALFTGMRRGEIVGLKWDDFDFEKHLVYVRRSIYKPKDGKAQEKPPKSQSSIRCISIPDVLCETLFRYREQQNRHISYMGDAWHNLNYVFTEENGLVMNPQTPTKQFDHFLKRHNIRHLKFHGLRHTSATLLLANGCDIKTVSMRLGHSDIETTNRYVHALEASDKKAAQAFDYLYKK